MSGVLEDIRSNKYVYLFSFMGFLCVLFCFGLFVFFGDFGFLKVLDCISFF